MYHIGIQLLGFVVFAPYSSMSKWTPVFSKQQHRLVPLLGSPHSRPFPHIQTQACH
ncbi:hypothetical protein RSAG8_12024, partial [Rhizoctonia solani AG-8 WAC10335]